VASFPFFTVCTCSVYACGRFYVGCNVCMEWFHGSCVGVNSNDVQNLSSFVCRSCSSRNSNEELHCICRTPYDESKYALCLCVTDRYFLMLDLLFVVFFLLHCLFIASCRSKMHASHKDFVSVIGKLAPCGSRGCVSSE